MQIAVSELKQHVHLLDEAKVEDIEVTKRGRPFVVVVDAERYQELIANKQNNNGNMLDMSEYKIDAFKKMDGMDYQKMIRDEW